MKTTRSTLQHPVPEKYHKILYIGDRDRRGNLIDFKTPPVIVDSLVSISDHEKSILSEYVPADSLPLEYRDDKCFIILRPTALPHRSFIREQLEESGLLVCEEFALNNFIKVANILYQFDPNKSFHLQWRIIMRSLHETGTQDQNTAIVFMFESPDGKERCNDMVMNFKKRIRSDMGEIPVIIRHNKKPEIALGIHHLHSPETDAILTEYNVLMHAKNKTSVFS